MKILFSFSFQWPQKISKRNVGIITSKANKKMADMCLAWIKMQKIIIMHILVVDIILDLLQLFSSRLLNRAGQSAVNEHMFVHQLKKALLKNGPLISMPTQPNFKNVFLEFLKRKLAGKFFKYFKLTDRHAHAHP